MVEVTKGNRTRLVASCLYPVEEGLVVQTNTEKVKKIRRMIVELLWPASYQYAEEVGLKSSRFSSGMADCCNCGLCVRYCSEVKKSGLVYFKGRGIDRKPALLDDAQCEFECTGCNGCFNLCPSGWIVSKNIS